jgi:hypothetical protein
MNHFHVPRAISALIATLALAMLVSLQHLSSVRQIGLMEEVNLRNPSGPRTQMNIMLRDSNLAEQMAAEESAFPNCAIAWRSCNDKALDCVEVWRTAGLLDSWKSACLKSK